MTAGNHETPPTLLTHAGEDRVVPVENSIRYYLALIKINVPEEMHPYPEGGHVFLLKQPAHLPARYNTT